MRKPFGGAWKRVCYSDGFGRQMAKFVMCCGGKAEVADMEFREDSRALAGDHGGSGRSN